MPTLLGLSILPIEVVIDKKISGTTTTSNILINNVPSGSKTVAFSLNINPTIVPIISEPINIIDCL